MVVRIIGAGAVGAVVAEKLSHVADTAFIIDEGRKERYESGIMLNGQVLDIPCLTPSSASYADLVIFAVKNFSLESAMEEAEPFIGPDTILMSLLNGIDAESILSEKFGPERVIYAFITDLSSVHSGLDTTCFSEGGNIIFGEKNGEMTERICAIKHLFDSAGQRYAIPDNILHEKWWKFMLNTCFNTLSAIIDADYAAISEAAEGFSIIFPPHTFPERGHAEEGPDRLIRRPGPSSGPENPARKGRLPAIGTEKQKVPETDEEIRLSDGMK